MKRLKVKTFWAMLNTILENEVNGFLAKIKPENVKDVKYSTSSDHTRNNIVFSVAIIYEEEENGNS